MSDQVGTLEDRFSHIMALMILHYKLINVMILQGSVSMLSLDLYGLCPFSLKFSTSQKFVGAMTVWFHQENMSV